MMKVAELIEQLRTLPGDAQVYCTFFDEAQPQGSRITDYVVQTVGLTQAGGIAFAELDMALDTDPTSARRN